MQNRFSKFTIFQFFIFLSYAQFASAFYMLRDVLLQPPQYIIRAPNARYNDLPVRLMKRNIPILAPRDLSYSSNNGNEEIFLEYDPSIHANMIEKIDNPGSAYLLISDNNNRPDLIDPDQSISGAREDRIRQQIQRNEMIADELEYLNRAGELRELLMKKRNKELANGNNSGRNFQAILLPAENSKLKRSPASSNPNNDGNNESENSNPIIEAIPLNPIRNIIASGDNNDNDMGDDSDNNNAGDSAVYVQRVADAGESNFVLIPE